MDKLGVPKQLTKSGRATPRESKGSLPTGKHAWDSRARLEVGDGGGQEIAAEAKPPDGQVSLQSEDEDGAQAPEGAAGDDVPAVWPGAPEPLPASDSSQAN